MRIISSIITAWNIFGIKSNNKSISYRGCFYGDKGSKRSTLNFFVQSVNLECHYHHCSNEEQGPKYSPYPVCRGHNSSQAMRGRVVAKVFDEGPGSGIWHSFLWTILADVVMHFRFRIWLPSHLNGGTGFIQKKLFSVTRGLSYGLRAEGFPIPSDLGRQMTNDTFDI